MLFSIVNVLRKSNINPETALRKANNKFINRYKKMETIQPKLNQLSLDEQEEVWNQAKKLIQSQ